MAELRCTWSLDTQDPKPIVLQVDLQLGPGDSLHVYDGLVQRAEHLLQVLSHHNNKRPAMLESSRGQMSVLYLAQPRSTGHGFNATYQVVQSASTASILGFFKCCHASCDAFLFLSVNTVSVFSFWIRFVTSHSCWYCVFAGQRLLFSGRAPLWRRPGVLL